MRIEGLPKECLRTTSVRPSRDGQAQALNYPLSELLRVEEFLYGCLRCVSTLTQTIKIMTIKNKLNNRKKGYSLIELLISAAIFVAAMTSVVTLIFIFINATNTALMINQNNYAIRQLNDTLQNETFGKKCLQTTSGGETLLIKSENCETTLKTIKLSSRRLVMVDQSGTEEYILPSQVNIAQLDTKEEIFKTNKNLLEINILFSCNDQGGKPIKTEYKNAYAF